MYWSIDNQNSAWYHRNIEGLKLITFVLSLIFIWSLNYEYTVDNITRYTNQTLDQSFDDDPKIETLFGQYWSFFYRWGLLLVGNLETLDRILLSM